MNNIKNFFKRLAFKTDHLKQTLHSRNILIFIGVTSAGIIFYSVLRDSKPETVATIPSPKFEVSKILSWSDQPSPSPSPLAGNTLANGMVEGYQSGYGVSEKPTPKPLPKLAVLEPTVKFQVGKFFKAKLLSGGDSGIIYALINDQKIKGQANSQKDRLMIHFDQILANNPSPISADAFDPEDQKLGVTGKVLSSYGIKLATALGLHFTAGMTEALQEREPTANGSSVKKSTVKNALLNGTVNAASEEAKELLSQARSDTARVDVEAGKDILIMFHPQ